MKRSRGCLRYTLFDNEDFNLKRGYVERQKKTDVNFIQYVSYYIPADTFGLSCEDLNCIHLTERELTGECPDHMEKGVT